MDDPEVFARTITGVYGPEGAEWLERLPDLIERARAAWGLERDGRFPLRYRYVEPVRMRDGRHAVLKLGPAFHPADFRLELRALEWFSGHGGVRVIAVDPELGAALMERVVPGTELRELVAADDEGATAVAADVMRSLWRPAPPDSPFPSVREWGEESLRGREAAIFAELCDSAGEAVVLHGDLHHENILRSGGGWVAIDPVGVVGEREYEVGALMHNPWPGLLDLPHPGRVLARRLDILTERLELDGSRIRAWAWATAVLSAAWSVEAGEDPAQPLACAELLEPLMARSTPSR